MTHKCPPDRQKCSLVLNGLLYMTPDITNYLKVDAQMIRSLPDLLIQFYKHDLLPLPGYQFACKMEQCFISVS